jgi:hypothetical protein
MRLSPLKGSSPVRHSEPQKMSLGAQNMKTESDALRTAENESRVQTWKWDPTLSVHRETSSGVQNMKTGAETLGTAENESGSVKYENGTRRPKNRQKRVQGRKTWKQDLTPSELPKTSLKAQNMKTRPDALSTTDCSVIGCLSNLPFELISVVCPSSYPVLVSFRVTLPIFLIIECHFSIMYDSFSRQIPSLFTWFRNISSALPNYAELSLLPRAIDEPCRTVLISLTS